MEPTLLMVLIGSFKDGTYYSLNRMIVCTILTPFLITQFQLVRVCRNRVDGAPALGWPDTIAFLALPIFLVISQFVSMELMQPKDKSAQQNNVVLKILPLMIGWFALNVPAALSVYWVINNIVTTVTTLLIRNSMDMTPVAAGGGAAAAPTPESIFAPPREKPAGFGGDPSVMSASASAAASGVKPISSNVVDAVIEEEDVETVSEAAGTGMGEGSGPKKVSH